MVDPASAVRRLAIRLHATDAAALLRSTLPYVLNALTPADLAKIQRILDADVTDPVLRQQYAAAALREIAREHAQGTYRDRSEGPVRFSLEMRRINDEEYYIRGAQYGVDVSVPYQKLLVPGALMPDAGHPAELTFLQQIRQNLDQGGITLHVGPTGQGPGPKEFWVWLAGPNGLIYTQDGRLTKANLLEYWLRPFPGVYQALRAPISKPGIASPDGIWFGLGAQEGGTLFFMGRDTMVGFMYSPDEYEDSFLLNVSHWRLGVGLGASIGAALVIATGGKTPQSFDGLKVGGFDFKAGLGENWGAFAESIGKLGLAAKITSSAGSLFAKSKLSVKEWQTLAVVVRNGVKGTKIANSNGPAVAVMSIPLAGAALEASVYYAWGDCSVL